MAVFNPETSVNLGENLTGRSQGQTPNKALGLLFGAIGDAVTQFKAGKAKSDEDLMNSEIAAGVQSINDNSLIPEASAPRHVGGAGSTAENFGELPDELQNAGNQLTRWRNAYNQGKMNPVDHAMKMDALAKRMRAKYGAKADAVLQKYDNASTANNLREQLNMLFKEEGAELSEVDKRRRKVLDDTSNYLADGEAHYIYKQRTGKDFNPNDFDESAWMYSVSSLQTGERTSVRRRQELADARLARADREELAIEYATKDAVALRNRMTYVGLGSLLDNQRSDRAPSGMESVQLSNLLENGAKATPEQKDAIRQIIGRIRFNAEQAAENLISGLDESGNSYAQYITDKAKRDEIKAIVTAPIDNIEKALTDGEFGILNAIANSTKAQKEAQENTYVTKDGGYERDLDLFIKKYGSKNVNDFFSGADISAEKGMSTTAVAIHNRMALELLGGRPAGEVLDELAATNSVSGKNTPAVAGALTDTVKFITNPSRSKEDAAKIALSVFLNDGGQNIIDKHSKSNPSAMLKTFVNPEMTAKLHGTEAWDEYTAFAYIQAGAVLRPIANQIIDAQTSTDSAQITFDDKTKRFVFTPKAGNLGFDPFTVYDLHQGSKGKKAVETMNSYLNQIDPILKLENQSTDVFLQSFFGSDKYKRMEKEGGLLTRMKELINQYTIRKTEETKGTEPPRRPANPGRGSTRDKLPDSPILSFISQAEGADYDTMFGGRQADLENMTVSQVLRLQGQNIRSAGHSPAGATQVNKETLTSLIKSGVVKMNDRFDAQTQDKIGHALLERAGYSDFVSGGMPADTFADNLAGIWASLPLASGKSQYEGIAGNKARVSRQQLMNMIEGLLQ